MMKVPLNPLTFLMALALLAGLTGCGGGATTSSASGADAPTLSVEGRAFGSVPQVGPGQAFNIENKDSTRHTFTSADDSWPEVELLPNTTVAFTVPAVLTPGRYLFFCTVHSDMGGALNVLG
jgi:plastocyanin